MEVDRGGWRWTKVDGDGWRWVGWMDRYLWDCAVKSRQKGGIGGREHGWEMEKEHGSRERHEQVEG